MRCEQSSAAPVTSLALASIARELPTTATRVAFSISDRLVEIVANLGVVGSKSVAECYCQIALGQVFEAGAKAAHRFGLFGGGLGALFRHPPGLGFGVFALLCGFVLEPSPIERVVLEHVHGARDRADLVASMLTFDLRLQLAARQRLHPADDFAERTRDARMR